MKIKSLFKRKDVEKLDPVNLKRFYKRIDEVYNNVMENGSEEEEKKLEPIKRARDAWKNGFISEVAENDAKNNTGKLGTILKLVGYDLNDREDYEFVHTIMLEEMTLKKYNGDASIYRKLMKIRKKLSEKSKQNNTYDEGR